MKIHRDHIYLTTLSDTCYFLKLNKKGEIVKELELRTPMQFYGIFIEGSNIYTCAHLSLTVRIFELNLKPLIFLKAIWFNEDTTPRDIILHKQQMFVLFSYINWDNNYHPDPIKVFKLDGISYAP